MTPPMKNHGARPVSTRKNSEFFSAHTLHPRGHARIHAAGRRALRVFKFGGTSVGDASCIARVAEIVRSAALESDIVIVVSAMSGVTNQLVAAARRSQEGEETSAEAIFSELRKRHISALRDLVPSFEERNRIQCKIDDLLQNGCRLCRGSALLGELTPRTRDTILSLGERLSILLVAAALSERGLASQAVEATEIVITNDVHDGADPQMGPTRERCEKRLRPLVQQSIVPVVTGFIGAAPDGTITTLGRGGSDYSATVIGAALGASEVIIWTDVDGLQTADPRMVPEARTIPEVSYREAAELAYFGAKVLHPKTLRPVMQCGIPLWIRNTFAPEHSGTKITPEGPEGFGGVTAVTAISEATSITLSGPVFSGVPDLLVRALRATSAARTDVLLLSHAPSQDELCVVITSAQAEDTLEMLRQEFSEELAHESEGTEGIAIDASVALITVVGPTRRSLAGISISAMLSTVCGAVAKENVDVIAMVQNPSECVISLLVGKNDLSAAVSGLHQEFRLADSDLGLFPKDGLYPPLGAAEPTSESSEQKY